MNSWINANAGAAVAPTNRQVTTKIRSILRMAFTSLPLRCSHGSKHEVLGESSTCTIFVCQALFLATNFEDNLLCELPRIPLLGSRVNKRLTQPYRRNSREIIRG